MNIVLTDEQVDLMKEWSNLAREQSWGDISINRENEILARLNEIEAIFRSAGINEEQFGELSRQRWNHR